MHMFALFDRKRWVLLFDFLAKYAQEPISIDKLYEIIVREGPKISFELSFEELENMLEEFKSRGIVHILKVNNKRCVVLSETAKYFIQIYSTTIIGL